MKYIEINDQLVELEKKRIKNMYLKVLPPDGRIHISAPMRMHEEEIKGFLLSKMDWIKVHQEKIRDHQVLLQSVRKPEFITGETLHLLGRNVRLEVLYEAKENKVFLLEDRLILWLRCKEADCSIEKRLKLLNSYYRSVLENEIPPLLAKWERMIGVKAKEWRIRDMKTRWGTCNIKERRIWFNLQLAKKPLECIEYVVVHELVHLLEKSHNQIFKEYMNQFLPGWRVIKARLNDR